MPCICPNESCQQTASESGVVCTCSDILLNIRCPEGCTTVILPSGNARCECADIIEPQIVEVEIPVSLNDPEYFDDVSWTIAFSPILGNWISFYGFYPNYYVSHNNYFQTGLNDANSISSLWSHLLTNKSFQVFYGKKQDFVVEYPVKEEYKGKRLNNISLWTEAKRYANDYDFTINPNLTFNKSLIYNNVVCSGNLNLIPQKNNFANIKNYPKTNPNGLSQDIIITNKDNFNWTYNYFYNRVKNNNANIPIILQDKNQIDKNANGAIVKFKGSSILNRMDGDWFLNRLAYNTDSRFSLTLKFAMNGTKFD
jgi:hypothetical protein